MLSKEEYKKLIEEDIKWLWTVPHSNNLEKNHIINVLDDSLDKYCQFEPQVSQNFCEWEWNTTFERHGIVSDCGHRLSELYRDHDYIYCPYCGKKIKTV